MKAPNCSSPRAARAVTPMHPAFSSKIAGLYGRIVSLSDGRQVKADDSYIRDSIYSLSATSWLAIEPVMPSYAGLLDDGEIQSLTAYIRSLASGQQADGEAK